MALVVSSRLRFAPGFLLAAGRFPSQPGAGGSLLTARLVRPPYAAQGSRSHRRFSGGCFWNNHRRLLPPPAFAATTAMSARGGGRGRGRGRGGRRYHHSHRSEGSSSDSAPGSNPSECHEWMLTGACQRQSACYFQHPEVVAHGPFVLRILAAPAELQLDEVLAGAQVPADAVVRQERIETFGGVASSDLLVSFRDEELRMRLLEHLQEARGLHTQKFNHGQLVNFVREQRQLASAHNRKRRAAEGGETDAPGSEAQVGEPDAKRPKLDGSAAAEEQPAREETIADRICAWWNMPYEQQLELKHQEAVATMNGFTNWMTKRHRDNLTVREARERYTVPLERIQPALQLDGYRNKCEFTIGRNRVGSTSIGFRMGGFLSADGCVVEVPTDDCRNLSPVSRHLCARLDDFLREPQQQKLVSAADIPNLPQEWKMPQPLVAADLELPLPPVYDISDHQGYWRLVLLREGVLYNVNGSVRERQLLVSAQVAENPENIWIRRLFPEEAAADDQSALRAKAAELFAGWRRRFVHWILQATHLDPEWRARFPEHRVVSIQFVNNLAKSEAAPNLRYEVEFGQPVFETSLLGQRFRLSPDAFFQINVPTAERLFQIAGSWAGALQLDGAASEEEKQPQQQQSQEESPEQEEAAEKAKPVLLDICCGAGTIGLGLARYVQKVIGLEIVESAVEDARANARTNGIKNAEYIAGPAEQTLPGVLQRYGLTGRRNPAAKGSPNVVGIVDPPRSGLHPKVVRTLRSCEGLERLVYVSCNPKSMVADLKLLCAPPGGKIVGTPFVVLKAQPVDMFPHTKHCEMVALLGRYEPKPRAEAKPDAKADAKPEAEAAVSQSDDSKVGEESQEPVPSGSSAAAAADADAMEVDGGEEAEGAVSQQ